MLNENMWTLTHSKLDCLQSCKMARLKSVACCQIQYYPCITLSGDFPLWSEHHIPQNCWQTAPQIPCHMSVKIFHYYRWHQQYNKPL